MKNKKTAFTLIELLVVITIMGILSSIGVSTFNGYVEKARLTKILSFSQDISRELKRQAILKELRPIGIWNFENNLDDSSGEGLDLIVVGNAPNYQTHTDVFQGDKFLEFTGGRIDHLSPNADISQGFTVSYFLQMPLTNSRGYPIVLATDTENVVNLANYYGFQLLPFGIDLDVAGAHNNGTIDYDFTAEKWHHILFTYENTSLKLYIDGELITEETYNFTGTNVSLIRIGNAGSGSDIYLDNLEFYPFAVNVDF